MSSICITGIGGYLGLATAYKLVEAGHTVTGVGSSAEAPLSLPDGVVYESVDIRDDKALINFFTKHAITTVYHFAAIKYVGKCEADPELCYEINTGGTVAVLRAMSKAQVPHIIYASTYAVYDWSEDQIILTEATLTNPATVYGSSKLRSEKAIIESQTAGLISRYHILRYGNIIGAIPELPTHTPQSFLDKMVLATKTGETIILNGGDYNTIDGTVARDFIDIRDVVHINYSVLSQPAEALYNVASGSATTLKQLVSKCEEISGKNIPLVVNLKTGNEPSSITIDCSLIRSELGYQPAFTLSDTILSLTQKLAI